jgi:hypothetical protein
MRGRQAKKIVRCLILINGKWYSVHRKNTVRVAVNLRFFQTLRRERKRINAKGLAVL